MNLYLISRCYSVKIKKKKSKSATLREHYVYNNNCNVISTHKGTHNNEDDDDDEKEKEHESHMDALKEPIFVYFSALLFLLIRCRYKSLTSLATAYMNGS